MQGMSCSSARKSLVMKFLHFIKQGLEDCNRRGINV
jgi:hypothetical protein